MSLGSPRLAFTGQGRWWRQDFEMKTRFASFALLFSLQTWLALGCQAQEAGQDFWDTIPASPSTQAAEKIQDDYWQGEFGRVNQAVAKADGTEVVFFGDSITLGWSRGKALGKPIWEEYFAKYKPINMGSSGDITPVMLYRIESGNLDFPEGQAHLIYLNSDGK